MRFSPETLETLGVFGYRRALKGQVSTAHPHYDTKRACHYNYIADFGMKSVYRLCRIGDDGKQTVVATLPVERPAYMHSFGMSEDHLVLTEFPLVVSPLELKFSGKPFIQNYRWEPERGLVFHIVGRTSAAWCAPPPPTPPSPFTMSMPSPMATVLRSMSSPIPTPPSSISFISRGCAQAPPSPRPER